MNTIFSKNFESKISLEKNFSLIELVWFNFFWQSSDIQLRSKHTRVKCFCWEEKLCLCDKRKENIQITGKEDKFQKFDIFYWKNYLKSCVENNHCDYVYVNRRRYLYECLITCMRKSIFGIGLEVLIFFTFIYCYEIIHSRA